VAKYGDAKKLTAIPLAIAGWCRYLLAVDDNGKPFELSPDPMVPELTKKLEGITLGNPDTYKGQLKDILSNANIFGTNLYEAGIGETIEGMFLEEIEGVGAVRKTLKKYLN
jgi:fructuronate reductase